MSFQNGHKINVGSHRGGRKGFEFETTQMKRMNKILNRMLLLSEKILDNKSDFKDQIKYETLQKTFLKIMDKLHPNKTAMDITSGGEPLFQPTPEEKAKAEKALKDLL